MPIASGSQWDGHLKGSVGVGPREPGRRKKCTLGKRTGTRGNGHEYGPCKDKKPEEAMLTGGSGQNLAASRHPAPSSILSFTDAGDWTPDSRALCMLSKHSTNQGPLQPGSRAANGSHAGWGPE